MAPSGADILPEQPNKPQDDPPPGQADSQEPPPGQPHQQSEDPPVGTPSSAPEGPPLDEKALETLLEEVGKALGDTGKKQDPGERSDDEDKDDNEDDDKDPALEAAKKNGFKFAVRSVLGSPQVNSPVPELTPAFSKPS